MVTSRVSNAIAFAFIFLSQFCGVHAAIFTVTNNNDSGSGSLRQAILDVNASVDTANDIVVALSGSGSGSSSGSIVFLQSALPSITNQVNLNGADQNSSEILTIDGSLLPDLTRGLEINGLAASNSVIEQCGIQNIIGTASVYGILITNQAVNCSIQQCKITFITVQAAEEEVAGIKLTADALYTGSIQDNYISNITLESSTSISSSDIFGIGIDGDIGTGSSEALCNGNTIVMLEALPGSVFNFLFGISARTIYGDCSNNTINNLIAPFSEIIGISATAINGNCNMNSLGNFSANDSGNVGGIEANVIGGSLSYNIVHDLFINDILMAEISIFGFRIHGSVQGDISYNCIRDLLSSGGLILGMFIGNVIGTISHNKLHAFESNSGSIIGLQGEFVVSSSGVTITNNIISHLLSEGIESSGEVTGIDITSRAPVSGTISGNAISDLHVSEAPQSHSPANGIIVNSAEDMQFVCNAVSNVSGGPGEDVAINSGILIFNGNRLLFSNNFITNIMAQGQLSSAHGIIGGVDSNDGGSSNVLSSSLFEKNVIHHITAESSEAYGITIGGSSSSNNQILANSISNIDAAAIFYEDDAPTDGTVELAFIECSGRSVTITGTIVPNSPFFNTDYLLQFFFSSLSSPEQIKNFLSEQVITVGDGPTQFTVMFEPKGKLFGSQFITATATAIPAGSIENLNTSVVSNPLFGCSTSIPGLCSFLATCPNDVLPTVDCPVPDYGTFGSCY